MTVVMNPEPLVAVTRLGVRAAILEKVIPAAELTIALVITFVCIVVAPVLSIAMFPDMGTPVATLEPFPTNR